MAKKKVTAQRKTKKPRGPKPQVLKIDRAWEEAVKDALKRGKPPASKADG